MVRPKRFVVVSDNHGDMVDEVSANALWQFLKDWKPEIRVHAGDAFDFRNLRKNNSEDERQSSLEDDWMMGIDFIRKFFDGGKSNHFLRGNHDERIYDYSRNANGLMRDYANDGIRRLESVVKRCNAKMLPYDAREGVLELGKLRVIHGYHAGAGACRSHANIYSNCLFGHVHSIESASIASREPAEARSIGCLCRLDMEYARKHTGVLKWSNGWAYGLLFADGTYQLFQTRKIESRFYYAKEVATFG